MLQFHIHHQRTNYLRTIRERYKLFVTEFTEYTEATSEGVLWFSPAPIGSVGKEESFISNLGIELSAFSCISKK